ncbi:type III pantothenate kinase [Cryomorpha ignava]|uniref:Type III pantothenate kinase n=1 Tax=Cryomorpha ignava TaxID=101383 RepID=A0A7K3WNG4_9FLAO|nr:type III pantothenate kinase [Cryomorpha ignava]NEN23034.1 type III pantothenate kinase [Cryomorpha ignava]
MSVQKSNMIIDIGNTRMKVALYVRNQLDGVLTFSNRAHRQVSELIENTQAEYAIISNVTNLPQPLTEVFQENLNIIEFDGTTPIPIKLDYKTPNTLGTDRIANAVGAQKNYPGQNVLIIDFGTCIKFDVLSADGIYRGGAISPGVKMRFKSMHQMTGKLPYIKDWHEDEEIWPGLDTRSSMVSGVIQGVQAEILRYIDISNEHYNNLTVIATGGDFAFFDKAFKNIIFANPYLTLQGLHEILLYNID